MNPSNLKELCAIFKEENDKRETEREAAVKKLNALFGDPEEDHGTADDILLEYLRLRGETEVADAFERARERVGFWYA